MVVTVTHDNGSSMAVHSQLLSTQKSAIQRSSSLRGSAFFSASRYGKNLKRIIIDISSLTIVSSQATFMQYQ